MSCRTNRARGWAFSAISSSWLVVAPARSVADDEMPGERPAQVRRRPIRWFARFLGRAHSRSRSALATVRCAARSSSR